MYIDKIHIDPPYFLAPMAGVTDRPFRILCKEMGAGILYTEFVSSEGIVRQNKKTMNYMGFSDMERPLGIQIFGANPSTMADAVKIIEEIYQPDLIDLNFGCPVHKVVKRGAGAALLKDFELMGKIARMAVEATSIPVTIKMRSGWDDYSIIAVEGAKMLESCGIKALTIHPRTAEMKYTGISDWRIIKAVKEVLTIPVIGNGDVKSVKDADRMFDETGCDAVMIGRWALGNPWIFRELTAHYTGEEIQPVTVNEKFSLIFRHLDMLTEEVGEEYSYKIFKTHIGWYTAGMSQAAHFRGLANQSKSLPELINILENFSNHQSL